MNSILWIPKTTLALKALFQKCHEVACWTCRRVRWSWLWRHVEVTTASRWGTRSSCIQVFLPLENRECQSFSSEPRLLYKDANLRSKFFCNSQLKRAARPFSFMDIRETPNCRMNNVKEAHTLVSPLVAKLHRSSSNTSRMVPAT